MKKVYELLNFLSQNNIKFKIEYYSEASENMFIETNKHNFKTYNDEHEVDVIKDDNTLVNFEIDELVLMYI